MSKKIINKKSDENYSHIHRARFRRYFFRNVILPAILIGVTVTIIFLTLRYFDFDLLYGLGSTYVIFTSFASSAFILFMLPKSKAAQTDKFLKSYFIAAIFGFIGSLLLLFSNIYIAILIILPLTSLALVIFKAEHPPAVGIAFAFIVFHIHVKGLILIILIAILMVLIRYTLDDFVYAVRDLDRDITKDLRSLRHRRINKRVRYND